MPRMVLISTVTVVHMRSKLQYIGFNERVRRERRKKIKLIEYTFESKTIITMQTS